MENVSFRNIVEVFVILGGMILLMARMPDKEETEK